MSADQPLPDILAPHLDVIFCGINPGMRSANVGHHFAGHSNRFWRTLHLAGFTPHQILPEDDRTILQYSCGLTTAVDRPTVSAGELRAREFADASAGFTRKIERYAPRYLAFLGKQACMALMKKREIDWGLQPERFAGAVTWVVPNPSGLNCAFRIDDLVEAYGELRAAAQTASISAKPSSTGTST